MKKIYCIVLLFCATYLLNGQEKEDISLLVTEDNWRKEAFKFPLPFAKSLDFKGVADVRFTSGWEDKSSPNFWSYAFGWRLARKEQLSEVNLEKYMQLYFDGLMNVVNKDKSKTVPKTIALFTSTTSADGTAYKGKIQIYDAFFTQEIITLNVLGNYQYCATQSKSVYIFKLSPQQLDSPVWTHINKALLREDICEFKLKED